MLLRMEEKCREYVRLERLKRSSSLPQYLNFVIVLDNYAINSGDHIGELSKMEKIQSVITGIDVFKTSLVLMNGESNNHVRKSIPLRFNVDILPEFRFNVKLRACGQVDNLIAFLETVSKQIPNVSINICCIETDDVETYGAW